MIFRVIVICIIAIKLVFPANVLNRSFSIPDLMKPGQIQVIDNRLFVTEKGSVLVIDLKNGELIRKFGKRGEGPGEFAGVIKIHPVENKIMVSSTGKISIFTLKGILIREVKIDGNSGISGNFQPFGSGFVGMGTDVDKRSGFRTISIYNKNLDKLREIYRSNIGSRFDSSAGDKNFFKKSFSFRVIGTNIYVSGDEGFIVKVFNKFGDNLFTINRKYKKLPFTSGDRKNFLSYLKSNSPDYVYAGMAKRLVFPEYYPSIFFLYSDGTILYIFTWKKSNKGIEAFLYDSKGKFISQKVIPIKFANPVIFSPFTINKGILYQLHEDEDEEIWKMYISNLQ